ncbi:MAG: hypothetical protein NZZ41_06840, partial [Candidatus Dojkabacteria bacterium]|nr:hypothetical protein [Candidatus Dojkabacteria bacterium]
ITNKSSLFKDLCLKKSTEASKILKKNNFELEKINQFFEKAEKHNDEIVIDCKKIYYHDKDKLLECVSKKFLLKNFYFNLYKREFGIFLTYLDGTVYDKLIF